MDILFKSIATRLEQEVPELRWIDWEQGQIDMNLEKTYPLQFPAVLIDFTNINWSSIKHGVQDGEVTVLIKVVFDIYEDLNNHAPDRDMALSRLELLKKIHKALHNFAGEILPDNNNGFEDSHFNRLERTSTSSERRDDGLKVINMLYVTLLRDQSGMNNMPTAIINDIKISAL